MTSGSTSRLSDILSTLNSLRRRTSLHGSIRSIASSLGSINSINSKEKNKKRSRRSSTNHFYSVYSPTMFLNVLHDPDAATKLFEAILDSPNGRRSLSRLARTCRALSDLVLNVLWRDLDSPIPLIGLFPATMMKKARKPGLGLSRDPDEEDWSKIMKYGERVRSLTYNESSSSMSPSIFPMLEHNRPRQYMLPNLQHLAWKVGSSDSLNYSNLFLNPELESLQLELASTTRFLTLNKILADVSSRMKLKKFTFTSPQPLPDSFVEIMAPQEALQKIVLVAPGAFSPIVGRWIASLPQLKSLQLDMSGRTFVAVEGFFDEIPSRSGDSTPSSFGTTDSGVFSGEELDFSELRKSSLRLTGDLRSKVAFASMRYLHLTGDVSNITVFLKHLSSPLTQLDLVIDDPPVGTDWMELSYMICERFGSSLQSLRISATGTSRFNDLVRSTPRAGPPAGRLSLEHLSPLPVLSRLEIDLPESIHFIAVDILQLASSCPNLEELRLCPLARFPVQTGPPKLTLADLAPLTAHCSRLHTLAVVINARGGSPEILSLRSISSDSLRRLHVGHSWVQDSLHVPILLSHLAPYLETLRWFHERNRPGYIEANAKGWERVLDDLPHLQSIRLMERKAATPEPLLAEPPPPVETAEKGIDATVLTMDQGVWVKPQVAERSTQFSGPPLVNKSVGVHVESVSVEINATPRVADAAVEATTAVRNKSIQALPLTASASVDATIHSVSKSVEALLLKPSDNTMKSPAFPYSSYLMPTSIVNLISLTCRIFIAYPMSIPFRILHAVFEHMPKIRRTSGEKEVDASSTGGGISMDNLQVRQS